MAASSLDGSLGAANSGGCSRGQAAVCPLFGVTSVVRTRFLGVGSRVAECVGQRAVLCWAASTGDHSVCGLQSRI
jgi:hypothetical protein